MQCVCERHSRRWMPTCCAIMPCTAPTSSTISRKLKTCTNVFLFLIQTILKQTVCNLFLSLFYLNYLLVCILLVNFFAEGNYGQLLKNHLRNVDKAEEKLLKACETAPDDPHYYLVLGNFYAKHKKNSKLAKEYNKKGKDLEKAKK